MGDMGRFFNENASSARLRLEQRGFLIGQAVGRLLQPLLDTTSTIEHALNDHFILSHHKSDIRITLETNDPQSRQNIVMLRASLRERRQTFAIIQNASNVSVRTARIGFLGDVRLQLP